MPALLFGRHTHTLPFTTGPYPLMTPHALPTLASSLAAAGYRTAAVLSRDLPLSPPAFAGFRDVITVEQRRPERNVDNAGAVADRALAWLATPADGPRFLWVHMLDPHQPYDVPGDTPRFPGPLGHYDAEIASADAAAGRIIAALDPARTIVVVTADHGEAFLDHHQRFHGSTLHEEEIHVPLVLAAPGLAARTITPSVSHLDLAPTLLDLVGLASPAGMQGLSLRAALHGAPLPPRIIVAASKPSRLSGRSLVAAYDGRTKIIRDLDAWTVEVYDLATDPGEHAPRRHGAEVARMLDVLDAATTAELATLPALPQRAPASVQP
jgi:arylsulfatase A-like enzyme